MENFLHKRKHGDFCYFLGEVPLWPVIEPHQKECERLNGEKDKTKTFISDLTESKLQDSGKRGDGKTFHEF